MPFERKKRPNSVMYTRVSSTGGMKQILHPSVAWATEETLCKRRKRRKRQEVRRKKGSRGREKEEV